MAVLGQTASGRDSPKSKKMIKKTKKSVKAAAKGVKGVGKVIGLVGKVTGIIGGSSSVLLPVIAVVVAIIILICAIAGGANGGYKPDPDLERIEEYFNSAFDTIRVYQLDNDGNATDELVNIRDRSDFGNLDKYYLYAVWYEVVEGHLKFDAQTLWESGIDTKRKQVTKKCADLIYCFFENAYTGNTEQRDKDPILKTDENELALLTEETSGS